MINREPGERLIEFVMKERQRQNMTISTLGKKAGMKRTTVSMMQNSRTCSFNNGVKLLNGLGLNLTDFQKYLDSNGGKNETTH